ncbi:helix-turn-helix transcriptional regulator [Paenibacillus sp. HW567]|uniref:helix-turn-helix transcriptional regulator n=1 Tax=Paenibacillus sp. HW567 TaxID=1034769 RepID=UPI0003771525|nr:WYL domain-containing protein [Paenibacillus sp. HW567]
MAKADQMLSILWMLKQRRRTAAELAEELELSVRSIYRYIDALCASGVPLIADAGPGGGYSLPEHFSAAPLFFDDGERRALVQASAFARGSGYPYVEALDGALAKLKRYSNAEQQSQMERQGSGLETLHSPAAPLEHLLGELESSTSGSLTLEMEYRKGNGDAPSFRCVDPYGLVLWKGQWYFAGFCHLRQQIRSFRVDRIARLQRTGASFLRPAGFSAREFLLQGLLPDQDKTEELISVVIEAPERVLNELCSHWLFGHTLEQRSSEAARFLLDEAAVNSYAPYFLLPYGRSLTIVEPAALKQKIAAVATDIAAHYSK